MQFTLRGGANDGKVVQTKITEAGQCFDVYTDNKPVTMVADYSALPVNPEEYTIETYISVRRCNNTHCWLEMHVK